MPNSLRARAAMTALAGLAAVAGLGLLARLVLPLTPEYPLKAAAAFAVVAFVAISRLAGSNHPFAIFGQANQVTTARAVFVALVAGTIGEDAHPMIAAGAAAAAMAVTMMDGVDGWLARRTGVASVYGARFDMEVDAVLILVLSTLAWTNGKAGLWVLLSGLLRYLFVAAGWFWTWMDRPLQPNRRRQAVCVIQIVLLIGVVSPLLTRPASAAVAASALAVLAGSFAVDTWWLLNRREQVA